MHVVQPLTQDGNRTIGFGFDRCSLALRVRKLAMAVSSVSKRNLRYAAERRTQNGRFMLGFFLQHKAEQATLETKPDNKVSLW